MSRSIKVWYRQGHGFFDIGIVVKILKGNGITVIVFDSGFTKGRPFEVFTEILLRWPSCYLIVH